MYHLYVICLLSILSSLSIIYLSVCLYLNIYLSTYLSTYLSIHPSTHPLTHLPTYPSIIFWLYSVRNCQTNTCIYIVHIYHTSSHRDTDTHAQKQTHTRAHTHTTATTIEYQLWDPQYLEGHLALPPELLQEYSVYTCERKKNNSNATHQGLTRSNSRQM